MHGKGSPTNSPPQKALPGAIEKPGPVFAKTSEVSGLAHASSIPQAPLFKRMPHSRKPSRVFRHQTDPVLGVRIATRPPQQQSSTTSHRERKSSRQVDLEQTQKVPQEVGKMAIEEKVSITISIEKIYRDRLRKMAAEQNLQDPDQLTSASTIARKIICAYVDETGNWVPKLNGDTLDSGNRDEQSSPSEATLAVQRRKGD